MNAASLYARSAGARLVRTQGAYLTVFAVREDLLTFVGLPDLWWIYELGFNPCRDIAVVPDSFLDDLNDAGIITLEVLAV